MDRKGLTDIFIEKRWRDHDLIYANLYNKAECDTRSFL